MRQMKVEGGLEEGCSGEKWWGRRDGGGREGGEAVTNTRESMQSLINSNSPRLRGGLSLQSFFFFSAPIFPFCLPALQSDLLALHSSYFLFLCFYAILYSSLCFQLCPLNPLICSPSNLFHLTPSQTHILNALCLFWVHLNKCCAKCFSQ